MPYKIIKGKSVTSPKGILEHGSDVVLSEVFNAETLASLEFEGENNDHSDTSG